ncbi:MAG: hypothetical protein JO131_08565 [Gammaproteobacteria bacterium]|nr:hypothetical protein [Gammaproteobacteria bacterium]
MTHSHTDISSRGIIIGCGHKGSCSAKHPPSEFITLDSHSEISPDIVANYKSDEHDLLVKVKNKLHEEEKLSSIIYEHFPEDLIDVVKLSALLGSDGKIVLVGSALEPLKQLPEGCKVSFATNKEDIIFLIHGDEKSKFSVSDSLQRYINSFLGKEHTYKNIVIKQPSLSYFIDAMYDFIEWKPLKDSPNLTQLKYLTSRSLEIFAKSETPENLSVLKQSITSLTKSYKPGPFRSIFSPDSKTLTINKLNHFLSKEQLTDKDVLEILKLAHNRKIRITKSHNPTRNKHGETSRIIEEVGALCLSYLANEKIKNVKVSEHKIR